MQRRTKWYIVTFLSWVIATAGLNFFVLFFLLPCLFWYVVGKKLQKPRSLLVLLSIERRFATLRRQTPEIAPNVQARENPDYFYVDANVPGILRRTLNVLVSALGLSLYLESLLANLTANYSIPGYPNPLTKAWVLPIILASLIILVLPFLLFPVWVYEDAGLRHYERNEKISIPGGGLSDQLEGAGIFLALFALLIQFATFGLAGLYSLVDFAGGIVLFVLPQSLLASVIFTFHVQPILLDRFRKSSFGLRLSKGSVRIDATNPPP